MSYLYLMGQILKLHKPSCTVTKDFAIEIPPKFKFQCSEKLSHFGLCRLFFFLEYIFPKIIYRPFK